MRPLFGALLLAALSWGSAACAGRSGATDAPRPEADLPDCPRSECTDPAPGMPNWECADGRRGGPACKKKEGRCGWHIVDCAAAPRSVSGP